MIYSVFLHTYGLTAPQPSRRKLQGVLEHLVVVDVEEVGVDEGLEHTGGDADDVQALLGEVSVDPVGDVEGSVQAQGKDVVDGEQVALALALEHKELREDGHRLQPQREAPRDLDHRELVVEHKRRHEARRHQVPDLEVVHVLRDFSRVLLDDEDGVERRPEEEQLHERVVHRPELQLQQTQVPCDEHQRVQELCFERDPLRRLLCFHRVDEDDDRHQMGHIS